MMRTEAIHMLNFCLRIITEHNFMVKVTNEVVIADFFWKNAKIYAH